MDYFVALLLTSDDRLAAKVPTDRIFEEVVKLASMRFLSALVSAFNSVRGQRTRSSTSKSSGLDPEPHPFSAQENRPALRGCWDISCTKEVVEKSLPRNKAFAFIMEV